MFALFRLPKIFLFDPTLSLDRGPLPGVLAVFTQGQGNGLRMLGWGLL